MKVTRDQFALPIAIGDTYQELAEMVGVNVNSVQKAFSRNRQGKKTQYISVEIDDIDDKEASDK